MKRNLCYHNVVILGSIVLLAATMVAQTVTPALPKVTYAELPYYPPGPHTVNLQGVVRIKVTTDGEKVTDAKVEDDGGVLAMGQAAQENVRTWKFGPHTPTTFSVTYRYIIDDTIKPVQNNPTIVFRFPSEVEVRIWRWPGTIDMPAHVK
jgi:TonB family protein